MNICNEQQFKASSSARGLASMGTYSTIHHVTSLSHHCHTTVTSLSHHCHITVTSLSHHCHITVTSLSHHCHITVTSLSHHCHITVTSLSHQHLLFIVICDVVIDIVPRTVQVSVVTASILQISHLPGFEF